MKPGYFSPILVGKSVKIEGQVKTKNQFLLRAYFLAFLTLAMFEFYEILILRNISFWTQYRLFIIMLKNFIADFVIDVSKNANILNILARVIDSPTYECQVWIFAPLDSLLHCLKSCFRLSTPSRGRVNFCQKANLPRFAISIKVKMIFQPNTYLFYLFTHRSTVYRSKMFPIRDFDVFLTSKFKCCFKIGDRLYFVT